MNSTSVKLISECFIKPNKIVEESTHPYYLSPWDLTLLPLKYIEHGHIFIKPKHGYSTHELVQDLKHSISLLLDYFYPLAGRLVINLDEQKQRSLVYVDCNKGPGVRFVHAVADITVSDLLAPTYVPPLVMLMFDRKNGGVNYNAHTQPLFSIQVTELVDGIFLGNTINHTMLDGTSYWHLLECWSEIYQAKYNGQQVLISRPPVLKRYIPEGYGPSDLYLPYTHEDEFIVKYQPPLLRERFFYFSTNTVRKLKLKANEDVNNQSNISSLQALLALVWRSIIKARGLPLDKTTHFMMAADNRNILNPPLPREYFGNTTSVITASTTVKELMENDLGMTAQLLHKSVTGHREKGVDVFFQAWFRSPYVRKQATPSGSEAKSIVYVGSSPRSNVYKIEFGMLGKPVAVRLGNMNKFDGKLYAHAGIEGGDSIELEVCLSPDDMVALESDHGFMANVSCPPLNHTPSRL